jgi:acyl dehydratase
MGLYVEDFAVDQMLVTRGRTIGEGDITLFAGLCGDFNPLHVDEEFCAGTPFGTRIMHGPLGLSMAIGLMSQLNLIDGTAMALLHLDWDFSGPVKIGDTIHAEVTCTEARRSSKPDRGVVTLGLTVVNQRGETVQVGSMKLLMRTRGP